MIRGNLRRYCIESSSFPSCAQRFYRHNLSAVIRRAQTTTSKGSPSELSQAVTAQDVRNLQQEIQSLQTLLQQQAQTHQERLESLTESFTTRTAALETKLEEINHHMGTISGLEKLVSTVRDFVKDTPGVRGVVGNLETLVQQSRPFVQHYKYVLFGTAVMVAILWKYRSNLVYERTSEEVADLARLTLEQESLRLSIQETLQTVANSPATLTTLNELLQSLIQHERTQQDLVNLLIFAVNTPDVQKALLNLLQVVFEDENLQKLSGEFLLKGLDTESVKKMLDDQTAELVRNTVADDTVQQATAVGLRRSLLYSVTPSFLWRLVERRKDTNTHVDERDAKDDSANQNDGDNDK